VKPRLRLRPQVPDDISEIYDFLLTKIRLPRIGSSRPFDRRSKIWRGCLARAAQRVFEAKTSAESGRGTSRAFGPVSSYIAKLRGGIEVLAIVHGARRLARLLKGR
jgi:plasmid stabilization system protein ParE